MDWKQRANSINKQWVWGNRHDQKTSGRLVRIVVGSWRERGWARFEVVHSAFEGRGSDCVFVICFDTAKARASDTILSGWTVMKAGTFGPW